ncbi:helix-turn-helix domain-containing protein [Mucilaginibacter auburnensis]|uniref:AraC-like DNA-binding protein n=1 Tax=Mucilaginibacter auburnensis TaxID=1457233 RepID=A0A2H9VUF5_9SPHI|nr:helix-turn-helix domain-containing protein [Mucilaginibacter auburnensis]PJJ84445.1 AraC-like DNA-binding protein [Mucilaginibacter auburnensis]
MHHQEFTVIGQLHNHVQGFWYREMEFSNYPATFDVLPDSHAEIIFYFGGGCSVLTGGTIEPLSSPFLVGLLGKTTYFQVEHNIKLIGIKCFPWAVYDLLKLPAVKGGVQRLTHPLAGLHPALNVLVSEAKVEGAITLLSNWLVNESNIKNNAQLNQAGRAMLGANGALPVRLVASAAHITVRTLERKFKTSSGNGVKNISNLIRFEQARDRLWCYPNTSISALAYELGYADQSHLNREFKRYSGLTAAAFAKQTQLRKKESYSDFVAIVLSSE